LLTDELVNPDLKAVIRAVEAELDKAKKTHAVYSEILEDVNQVRKVLSLPGSGPISGEVRNIRDHKTALEHKFTELECSLNHERQEGEQIRREKKRNEDQLLALKQWENWGHRVHRVVHEAAPIDLRGKELRLALEEALLASVAHRVIFARTQSLRDQKQLLTKFDRRLLITKQTMTGRFRPLILLCMFTRRIGKMAGHLPLAMSLPIETPIRKPEQPLPRKEKSRHSSSTKTNGPKSPLRPLIPLYV
jgi:hypothetical protein